MLPGAAYPVSSETASAGQPGSMLRTARQTKTCVAILKSVSTGSVEFFNRLLIRPGDVLVPSPADPPKIYPRINRSGVIRLLSLGLPRRAPVFRGSLNLNGQL